MTKAWIQTVPILDNFAQLAETTGFAAMPGDWYLGVADVVDYTGAIQSGHYKAVNMADAGVISAVANALGGDLTMFAFGGDGATFAIPAEQKGLAAMLSPALRCGPNVIWVSICASEFCP